MSKQKDNIRKIGRNLKIITAFIVGVLILLSIAICVCCGVLAYKNEQSIGMEDWLMAGCALLSMFGTIFLACVSVFQSDRANKLNERVIKQNEELQKMNDTQFKIANQNFFPVLSINNIRIKEIFDSESSNYLTNWENKFLTLQRKEGNIFSSFQVDCRVDKDEKKYDYFKLTFDLINEGVSKVQDIIIYKIAISKPLNNKADVKWPVDIGVLNSGGRADVEIFLAHNVKNLLCMCNPMELSLYINMKNLMGLTFYEKITILINFRQINSKINEISVEKLID